MKVVVVARLLDSRQPSPTEVRMLLIGLVVILGLVLPPPVGEAQQAARVHRVGVLGPTPIAPTTDQAFRQGLRQFGHTEGQTLVLEYRDAEAPRLPALAAELIRLKVDVIYARGPAAVKAAKDVTSTIPIVAIDLESDPVAQGFVRGFGRPGRNITGVFLDLPELGGKQMQLLKEIIPRLSRIAVLGDPGLNAPQFQAIDVAAHLLEIAVKHQDVMVVKDFARALDAARRGRA